MSPRVTLTSDRADDDDIPTVACVVMPLAI
jgi:hypothetical protein